jgi:acetyl-CoA carboxylase biotin carboxylase subunit
MATSRSKKISRVLIANRGEIAVRIIRACRERGISTVAVYSTADRASEHVRMADASVHLPGNTSAETYLNIPALTAAIKASGADAVHPGYGFLSESETFAAAVTEAGAKFIGPPPEAMHRMGDKIEAKRIMRAHKVPTVPGSQEALSSVEDLQKHAKEIGYPMILKAAAGGGGRGMRVVRSDADLAESFAACAREAAAWFGNPAVFCERYIENPRHIEVQVLFDEHGSGVHLFERDCSIQRRHQKLIEEAPSCYLNHEQRMHLGEIAVRAAAAAGYQSAGTVEFICESPDRAYFMEMNTRIQVEHPVTEMITGIDLIAMQLAVASGEPLPFKQSDITLRGWAFEARINAEDPARGFAPAPGLVTALNLPGGPGVRVDTHLYSGYEIPPQYDSMIAKLIVTGRDRDDALSRLGRALREIRVEGVPTTAAFHEALISHPDFRRGVFTTRFLEEQADWFKKSLTAQPVEDAHILDAALLAAVLHADAQKKSPEINRRDPLSPWEQSSRRGGRP